MRPGDIVAVAGRGWLARGIIRATGGPPSHVGLLIATQPLPIVLEALTRVTVRPLAVSCQGAARAWLLHDRTLRATERRVIVADALTFAADGYGYGALLLQALDACTHTTWWTDRWARGLDTKPICSYLVAHAYERVGRYFGQADRSTTPADIFAWAAAHRAKYTIRRLATGAPARRR
jgi:hypothetical protein